MFIIVTVTMKVTRLILRAKTCREYAFSEQWAFGSVSFCFRDDGKDHGLGSNKYVSCDSKVMSVVSEQWVFGAIGFCFQDSRLLDKRAFRSNETFFGLLGFQFLG